MLLRLIWLSCRKCSFKAWEVRKFSKWHCFSVMTIISALKTAGGCRLLSVYMSQHYSANDSSLVTLQDRENQGIGVLPATAATTKSVWIWFCWHWFQIMGNFTIPAGWIISSKLYLMVKKKKKSCMQPGFRNGLSYNERNAVHKSPCLLAACDHGVANQCDCCI